MTVSFHVDVQVHVEATLALPLRVRGQAVPPRKAVTTPRDAIH